MAKNLWRTPVYKLVNKKGKPIKINVTNSVSAGLVAKGAIFEVIDYLKTENIESVLDFGAGALRHCFPFLNIGISVCAVEYKEQFVKTKEKCVAALSRAKQNQYFSSLVFPSDFLADRRKFDLVLLCYVLNIMPIPEERVKVIDYLRRKMNDGAYLLYMAQWENNEGISSEKTVTDGYYKGPENHIYKTFYKEMNTSDTHEFFKSKKFKRVRSFGKNGNEQIFLYRKEKNTWV